MRLLLFVLCLSIEKVYGLQSLWRGLKTRFKPPVPVPVVEPPQQPAPLDESTRQPPKYHETVIVGAGLAGLSCATYLKRAGKTDFVVLESAQQPGGRIATDIHEEGYRLDRGFQVFLEEYPESRRLLQEEGYTKLDLQPFRAGALVYFDNGLHCVSDPLRAPEDIIKSVLSPIGSLLDKCKVGLYSVVSRFSSVTSEEAQQLLFTKEEKTTLAFLQEDLSISEDMINRFFRPFYRGIFLCDLALQSSRMFEFVFLMFARASASLPKAGMGALPVYLADDVIGRQFFRFGSRVEKVAAATTEKSRRRDVRWSVTCRDGAVIDCSNVVVAADPESFVSLLQTSGGDLSSVDSSIPAARGSVCLYYGFDGPAPVQDATLVLNGDPDPEASSSATASVRVNNVCFPSQVSSSYAPPGKGLASVTLLGSAETLDLHEVTLDYAVRSQLSRWWGQEVVGSWKLLRVYRIPYAQPSQTPPNASPKDTNVARGLYVVGDHRDTATLNGAIKSGRLAAQQVIGGYA